MAWIANRSIAAALVMGVAPLHVTALSLICSVLVGAVSLWLLTPHLLRIGATPHASPAPAEIPIETLMLGQQVP